MTNVTYQPPQEPQGYPPVYPAPMYDPNNPQGYAHSGYPPYGAPMIMPTNTLAILALVFAFLFAPVGIILGHMARRQIRQTGEQGDGLALAGMICGYVFTALYVGFLVIWLGMVLLMFNTAASTAGTTY